MFRQSTRRHLKVTTSTFTALMSRHGQMCFMDVLKWNCVYTQTGNILTSMKLSAVRLNSLHVNKLSKDCKNILLIKFLYGENSPVIQYKCNFSSSLFEVLSYRKSSTVNFHYLCNSSSKKLCDKRNSSTNKTNCINNFNYRYFHS